MPLAYRHCTTPTVMRKMPFRERLDDEGDSKLRVEAASQKLGVVRRGAHLDTTTTRRGSAKRNAAFTLQHGAMLTTRQPEGCVPVVVSRCVRELAPGKTSVDGADSDL